MAKRKEVTIEQVRRTVRKNHVEEIQRSIQIAQIQLKAMQRQERENADGSPTSQDEKDVAIAVLEIEADVRFYLKKAEEALLSIKSLDGAIEESAV